MRLNLKLNIQGNEPCNKTKDKNMSQEKNNKSVVALETSMGIITLELDNEKAPLTVENFLSYVKSGFFSNTLFHRVIPGFMIQGGGFLSGMKQKATEAPIKNEADNGLPNSRGTIAMARTQIVDSATSQFFINLADNTFLNFKNATMQGFGYCVFGKVIEGMEVVDAIAGVKTGQAGQHGDVPLTDVLILSATQK